MNFYNEEYYRKKALKYEQKIEQLINQNAGVNRAKYLENVNDIPRNSTTNNVGRTRYLENYSYEPKIRNLKIITIGGNILYNRNNVTFNQLKNITIHDYPMFAAVDFSKLDVPVLDRQYPYTTAFRPDVPILYGDQFVTRYNLKDLFIQMCNDSNVTLNITPGKKYETHIHDQNNVSRYFEFYETINLYDGTGDNLYNDIKNTIGTDNFVIYVYIRGHKQQIDRKDILRDTLFVNRLQHRDFYIQLITP